ncbi:minor structural protein GP20 [Lachnotalea glycerini]|uniref:Minor structural protein GP20 n=2 Tax=Lachnotalea glycerini TaxID=1763509 RepID=A0A318EL13_9FIRM|nr:minor structural protein GP20 [Lachnotalea glycerini]
MEFLKELLGENYSVIETAINTHNAKPENKDKQIKIGNLANGEYVSKDKYATLESEKKNLEIQITTLNGTIETLKKDNKGNDAPQNTIKENETTINNLKLENETIKKEYSLKDKLREAGVNDPDYLIYKHGGVEKFNYDKDGSPVGVEDSIKRYKDDKTLAHLFKADKPPYNPAGGGDYNGKNPFEKDSFNLTEQGKLMKENPAQAKELASAAGIVI